MKWTEQPSPLLWDKDTHYWHRWCSVGRCVWKSYRQFKNVIELWHFETNVIIIYMIYCNNYFVIKENKTSKNLFSSNSLFTNYLKNALSLLVFRSIRCHVGQHLEMLGFVKFSLDSIHKYNGWWIISINLFNTITL